MEGCLVFHDSFGLARVLSVVPTPTLLIFDDGSIRRLDPTEGVESIRRVQIEPGSVCVGPTGQCVVVRCLEVVDGSPFQYEVVSGPQASSLYLSERELIPLRTDAPDPVQTLLNGQIQSYNVFRAREDFRATHLRNVQYLGRFRSLLSSRIDLLPHQISVASTVLNDPRKRYILADEVGLGKTIEAGIIIHELLASNSNARVLIICPGSLAQQWLCEMYSKFAGRIFTMLDLRRNEQIQWDKTRMAIVSTTRVALDLRPLLEQIEWDLVVVDEAHHLLGAPYLYDFVKNLSRQNGWLLLLSALPAQRREDEFLRLLCLLEPTRYGDVTEEAVGEFRRLFSVQTSVGRVLRQLRLRLDQLAANQGTLEQLSEQLGRIGSNEVFAMDRGITNLVLRAQQEPSRAAEFAEMLQRRIAERYRINRRILRNRRKELLQTGELKVVERKVEFHPYEASFRELQATAISERLLKELWEHGAPESIRIGLSQMLLQGLSSVVASLEFIKRLDWPSEVFDTADVERYLSVGYLAGYDESARYQWTLLSIGRRYLDVKLLGEYVVALKNWNDAETQPPRLRKLRELLMMLRQSGSRKVLIFAGFLGLASQVSNYLREHFGPASIATFTFDMDREAKERAALEFERDSKLWIMVSDESGGEGRNFQFADALVHVDHPWQASRIEQRIGRLDRLGRAQIRPDVTSHLVYRAGSTEEGLIRCFAEGLQVYTRSISGLEFALRDLESLLTRTGVLEGIDGLLEVIPEVARRAKDEQTRDEAEAVFDAASNDEAAAAKFQAALHHEESEGQLERAFIQYFRMLSSHGSAVPQPEAGFPTGFWHLRPENVKAGVLGDTTDLQSVIGTFQRKLAQRRLDLAYFQVGNGVYDDLVSSLDKSLAGKTYALQGLAPDTDPWVGMEFVFNIAPGGSIEQQNGLITARHLVASHPVRVFVRLDGCVENDPMRLQKIRYVFTPANKNKLWMNLSGAKAEVLQSVLPADGGTTLRRLQAIAAEKARVVFEERIGQALRKQAAALERLTEEARRASESDSPQTVSLLEALSRSVKNWTITTDSVGFLAINEELVPLS